MKVLIDTTLVTDCASFVVFWRRGHTSSSPAPGDIHGALFMRLWGLTGTPLTWLDSYKPVPTRPGGGDLFWLLVVALALTLWTTDNKMVSEGVFFRGVSYLSSNSLHSCSTDNCSLDSGIATGLDS